MCDELSGRERVYGLRLGALSELEAFLAELRAPGRRERRLMALEIEVHRVTRARREYTPKALRRVNDSKKDTA